ncbi:MAG: hypothetical protein FWC22_00695 [Treponema sp.]|nr:hypothetical protein [Treponema sp.]
MINVDAEVSKYKNIKDRDEIGRIIKEYKDLTLQHANDMILAGRYNSVVLRLQEIHDKLPAPPLKRIPVGTSGSPTKTAKITKEEKVKINDAWNKKANKGGKR